MLTAKGKAKRLFKDKLAIDHFLMLQYCFSFQLVMDCWNAKPNERPTFDELTTLLETILMEDTPYFDPGLLDESNAYYSVVQEEEVEAVVETI